jgi:methylated-DNA-protein-cysteine methyltransferase-like protein
MPFSTPPDPKTYYERVYTLTRAIPAGRVMTYGGIARFILPPAGVDPGAYLKLSPRWVGSAMAACPDDVPWQRVINSQGKISPRPGMGYMVQRKLLEQEGVAFDDRERVNLKQYAWEPGPDWLRENGYVVWQAAGASDPPPDPDTPAAQGRLF